MADSTPICYAIGAATVAVPSLFIPQSPPIAAMSPLSILRLYVVCGFTAFLLAGCGSGTNPADPKASATNSPEVLDTNGSLVGKRDGGKSPGPPSGNTSPSSAESNGSTAKTPAEEESTPGPPTSLKAAAAMIDFTEFPMLESAKLFHKTPIKVGYELAKPNLKADFQFYHDKLLAAGWKEHSANIDLTKEYALGTYSKKGYFVDVSIVKNPNDKKMMAFAENQGNLDARNLPRPAGAVAQPHSGFHLLDLVVQEKPADAAKWVRAELAKHGWREVKGPQGNPLEKDDESYYLRFIQNGVEVGAQIEVEEGKTKFRYNASLMAREIPILPETKGRVEFLNEPFVQVVYGVPVRGDKVIEFYRKEMADRGWTVREPNDAEKKKAKDDAARFKTPDEDDDATKDGDKKKPDDPPKEPPIKLVFEKKNEKPLRLELLDDGKISFILIATMQ